VITRDRKIRLIEDFLVDDQTWSLRFLKANLGRWFGRQSVLIPTMLLQSDTDEKRPIPVELTSEEMRHCFRSSFLEAIDGRYRLLFDHRSCPARFWSSKPNGDTAVTHTFDLQKISADAAEGSHLRSVRELLGYHIVGNDGEAIAAVADLEVDSVSWGVRKIVVQIGAGIFSSRATICPACVEGISPMRMSIQVDGTQDSFNWRGHSQFPSGAISRS
jgi:sporulation protein YlmC with PRC-barrel domain